MDAKIENNDIIFVDGDIVEQDSRLTAISVALLSDAAALPDEANGNAAYAGWWAGDIGSKLWLLDRAKILDETRLLSEAFTREALSFVDGENVTACFSKGKLEIGGEVNL